MIYSNKYLLIWITKKTNPDRHVIVVVSDPEVPVINTLLFLVQDLVKASVC